MSEASLEDLYRTLQVAPNADLEAIRAAYRRLARLYHPDRNPQPQAAVQMRLINAAYAVLSDPGRRAAYDARRFLPRAAATATAARGGVSISTRPAPPRRQVVVQLSNPPTSLQHRVDRIVAVLGVLLLIAIGFYTVSVIPYAEQQFQAERLGQSQSQPYHPVSPQSVATAQAAAHQPAAAHAAVSLIPDRLRLDATLRTFPGTVLVAPSSLAPFRDLPILRLDATGQGIARYAVYYGDLTTGGATISGLVGRAAFDAAPPHLADCAPDAAYCVGSLAAQPTGSPGVELFRAADLVEGFPAFLTHRVCCNGVFWSLSWYEPSANMSYTIDLSRNVAAQFGSPAAEADQAAARAVAALAPQLVRLP